MRSTSIRTSLLLASLALPAGAAGPDHPLITPYEGSKLHRKDTKEFDEYELRLAPEPRKRERSKQTIEGRVTLLEYRTPKERSALEVFRNYESALARAGFAPLYSCKGYDKPPAGCGDIPGHYLATRLRRAEGDVTVALSVFGYQTSIAVVEAKPMEEGKVRVSAETLQDDIARHGHAAVYEILFDTDKADVKPESEAALAEIAKMMKGRPELRIHVVGHTDATGALEHNVDLSRRRAASVVAALSGKHGITAARLRADGVGPLAPVVTNRTEEGRAKNRRVELVEQ